jgi:hypothetical protein
VKPGEVSGEYEVIGMRRYREHKPRTRFTATMPADAEQRALQRGDIALIRRITPQVPPGYVLPDGWLKQKEEVS